MLGKYVVEFMIILMINLCLTELQDHIILWDVNNWRFKENYNDLLVNEGDNLIFICPPNRTFSQNLYWTDDPRVYLKCDQPLPIKVIKLLDCCLNNSASEFVLKVSQFPEIAYLPSFNYESPVHFVAQSVICQHNNFRLSVKLTKEILNHWKKIPSNSNNIKLENSNNHSTNQLFGNVIDKKFNVNHNVTTARSFRTGWIEYRFLLLPATLAFFTLVGMQIVLCGFWIPTSVTSKLTTCIRKIRSPRLKNVKDIKSGSKSSISYQSNIVSQNSEQKTCIINNVKQTKSNECLCWNIPMQIAPDSSNKFILHTQLNQHNLYNQNHFQNNPFNYITTMNKNIRKDLNIENCLDKSTIICNCSNDLVGMQLTPISTGVAHDNVSGMTDIPCWIPLLFNPKVDKQ